MKAKTPRDGGALDSNGRGLFDANDSTHSISVCDFCSTPWPRWIYPCAPYTLAVFHFSEGTETHISTSDWAACDNCRDAIERGDYARLVNRQDPRFRAVLRQVYERFARSRLGAAYEAAR